MINKCSLSHSVSAIEIMRSIPKGFVKPQENVARELESMCRYTGYPCTRSRVDGHQYCLKHILEDKMSPYRQCTYTFPTNGKRCHNATPKKESGGMCEEHTRLAQHMRQKSVRRHKPPITPESLMVSLAHYAKIEKKPVFENNLISPAHTIAEQKEDTSLTVEPEDSTEDPDVTKALDPFVDIDAFRVNNSVSRIMDYASESESDQEPWTVNSWPGQSFDSSDSENIEDDRHDDKLRQAGVYTEDEANLITKEKLIRLQSLYIEQFQRLQHILRERKRDYLHALKKEKETLAKIHSQARDTPKEQRLYEKLKSLNRYHKHSGLEAVLQKKSYDRRALHTEGVTVRPPPTVKCIFTEGGVKCGERTLPMAKHCQKHILSDSHQVLFRACGYTNGSFTCNEPVLDIFKDATCVFHRTIPPLVKKPKLEDTDRETKPKNNSQGSGPAAVVQSVENLFNMGVCLTTVVSEGSGVAHSSSSEHNMDTTSDNLVHSFHEKRGVTCDKPSLPIPSSDKLLSGYVTDTTETASEKDPMNSTMESVGSL